MKSIGPPLLLLAPPAPAPEPVAVPPGAAVPEPGPPGEEVGPEVVEEAAEGEPNRAASDAEDSDAECGRPAVLAGAEPLGSGVPATLRPVCGASDAYAFAP
jgi:hypothetical protein